MTIGLVILFTLSILPFVVSMGAVVGDHPKAARHHFYAFLVRFVPLLIVSIVLTIVGGLTVLRTLEVSLRYQLWYALAISSFWVACTIKNYRDLHRLFGLTPSLKSASLADEALD